MASVFGNRDVVRMRVKKCDGLMQPEYKKLCVDPQITSFEIMRSLLAKAFKIKSDFTISYLSTDERGGKVYLTMLSDWDLDAAFFGASDPLLKLKVDLKPFEEGLDDWDIVPPDATNSRLPRVLNSNIRDASSILGVTLGSFTTHVNKTVSQVSKAMGFKAEEPDPYRLSKCPMTDKEFHHFMDNVGHMVMPQQFRLSVYQGGVENSLRKVVWRHLLNVFPEGMTGKERFDYLKRKTSEYYKLRDEWRHMFSRNNETEEIKYVTNLVKKDVLRTDRSHKFYAGSDESQNVVSLFNILVTYALTHPEISYCQGMSDLASPILVVQNDEAHAYICFCGLMSRLTPYFSMDGHAMMVRFQHLSLLLKHHDPEFFTYLKQHKADDMFFCYRWLLLELKREFPFEDALLMLEIMWSSLPPSPPQIEIDLADPLYFTQGFGRVPSSPTFTTNNPYMKLKSMRQHSQSEAEASTAHTASTTAGNTSSNANNSTQNLILDSNNSNNISVGNRDLENRTLTPSDELSQLDLKDFEEITIPQSDGLQNDIDHIEMSLGHVTMQTKPNSLSVKNNSKNRNDDKTHIGKSPVDGTTFNICNAMCSDISNAGGKKESSVSPEVYHTPCGTDVDQIDLISGSNMVEDHFTIEKAENDSIVSLEMINTVTESNGSVVNTRDVIAKSNIVSVTNVVTKAKEKSNSGGDNHVTMVTSPVSPQQHSQSTAAANIPLINNTHSSSDSNKAPAVLSSSPQRPSQLHIKNTGSNSNCDDDSKTALVVNKHRIVEKTMTLKTESSVVDINSCEEALDCSPPLIGFVNVEEKLEPLPSPGEFGHGNPFLVFLCLSLFMQHRDHIIRNRMDYNDLAMYYDKMVRKHGINRVLYQAQSMYGSYLKQQAAKEQGETDNINCV